MCEQCDLKIFGEMAPRTPRKVVQSRVAGTKNLIGASFRIERIPSRLHTCADAVNKGLFLPSYALQQR